MTSYPPSDGGDQQRRPGDEDGASQGGSPQESEGPDAAESGGPVAGEQPREDHPPQPYTQQPYPQQGDPPPAGYPGYPPAGPQQPYPQPGYPQHPYPQQGYPPPGGYSAYPQPGYPGWGLDPNDPLVATSFGDWFTKSIGVLSRSWKPLLVIQVLTAVPVFVLGAAIALLGLAGLPAAIVVVLALGVALVGIAAAVIGQGASFWYLTHEAAGARTEPAQAFRFGVSRAWPLFGWGLLAGLIVFIGFLLLVVPAIYLGTVLFIVAAVVLYEGGGIDRCFSLVNRRFFPTLGRLALFVLGAIVYYFVLAYVVEAIFGSSNDPWVEGILQILAIPISLLAVGMTAVSYAELRHHEAPGTVTTPRLLAEMQRP